MAEMDYRREINEALLAGREALRYLNEAADCLNSQGIGESWICWEEDS